MYLAELVFFMGPKDVSMRKVVNTRMQGAVKGGRPSFIPTESKLYAATVGTCGEGMLSIATKRPLNSTALEGGNGTYVIPVGEPFDFLVAGLYKNYVFDTTYDKMPGHTGGKGFYK
jgi:hypothetical protein